MYYLYVLVNLDKKSFRKFYVGVTDDLMKRVAEHNDGQSNYTSKFGPWKLVYYEAYLSATDAGRRERQLKHHGKGFQELKKRLSYSIQHLLGSQGAGNETKKVRD